MAASFGTMRPATKRSTKPSRWTLTDAGAADVADDPSPPEWIDHEPIVQLSEQRYGAPVIESTLVSNVPAETQLLELFQGSGRKEVKSLVARSSIHVGLFQPFIDALRDSEQKANWKTHIDTLRAAMALSPESAEKVWQALVDQRGKPAAADLYEMLCGYNAEQIGQTPEQMKTGADRETDQLAGRRQPRLPRAGRSRPVGNHGQAVDAQPGGQPGRADAKRPPLASPPGSGRAEAGLCTVRNAKSL